jgi:hypothetical protein
MDVIDRYFRTLRVLLPRDQRDDIMRELSEEVQSQVGEEETALGRRLNARERAAIVGQYGHPLLTAARYRPQRHLIGPIVFPYYWIVLRLTLGLVVMGNVLGAAVLLAGGASAAQIGQLVENAIATVLQVAAWITALGAVADFSIARSRVLEQWNPVAGSSLAHTQRVIAGALASVPDAHHRTAPSSFRQRRAAEPSVSGLVIGLVLGVWWLAGLRFPYLFFGSGAAGLEWGPAMDRLYPVLVIAQFMMLAEQFVKFARPESTGLFRVARCVLFLAGLALVYLVATSDRQWMLWRAGSSTRAHGTVVPFAGRNISLIEFVNSVWSIVFIVVATLIAWGLLKALSRRFRGTPMPAHA